MKDGLRLVKLIIVYLISSVSSIVIWGLNNDLIKTSAGADTVSQLGMGLSKIILIPLYIILFLVSYSLSLSSFITSIKLIGSKSKTLKIFSIIMLILSLALIGFVIYITVQSCKLF